MKKWSPSGHQVVTSWSRSGHQVVTKWSPGGHEVVTKCLIILKHVLGVYYDTEALQKFTGPGGPQKVTVFSPSFPKIRLGTLAV